MRKILLILLVAVCIFAASADDIAKSFDRIVKDYGYPFEQHYVTTSDGYILKLFRIQHGIKDANETSTNGRPAILIQHGIFDSADFVLTHGPDLSPAFYLANAGYDVWVANSRGNKYSRQHKTLNPDKDAKFWDFSFADMVNDYKANIEHVRSETGQTKIAVIGHSQGTSSMYAGLSTDAGWFKDRVSIFVSLGSVARLDNLTSKLLKFIIETPIVLSTVKKLGIEEMFPSNFLTKSTFILLCGAIPQICQFGAKIIADSDPRVDSSEWARIYFGHFPSGSSTKCLEHYSQIFLSKKYQSFDYGAEENMRRYGTRTPPEYPLNKVSVPVAKFTGSSDVLGDAQDNEWLSAQLAHTLVFDKVYDYGHLSFFIAKDMNYLADMLEVLRKYHHTNTASEEVGISS
mmetsp:Transcript_35470/g.41027  ORF Transcript_35470/g.41027 Transcript_35470/m.41027 type:complete len:402 (-) Transcript_35470:40-1245(-)